MDFKKVRKIAAIAIVGVSLVSTLTGCSDDDSDSSSSTEVSHKPKLTRKQRIEKEVKRDQKALKDSKVAYNKDWNAITITPKSQEFTAAVEEVLNDGNGESQSWKNLTKQYKELSLVVVEKIEDPDISVALVNPNNPDKILYSAKDGKTTYDVSKDNN